jgi:putative oxidoreductase
MKIISLFARLVLGAIFVASGIMGILPGHAPSFSTELAKQYMAVMQATPYGHVLFAGQIVCGLLLIADLFVPMALVVLGAYLFNIVMFHIFIEPAHYALALLLAVLWVLTFLRYRDPFRPLLQRHFTNQSEAR